MPLSSCCLPQRRMPTPASWPAPTRPAAAARATAPRLAERRAPATLRRPAWKARTDGGCSPVPALVVQKAPFWAGVPVVIFGKIWKGLKLPTWIRL